MSFHSYGKGGTQFRSEHCDPGPHQLRLRPLPSSNGQHGKRHRLHPGARAYEAPGQSQRTSISEVPTRLGVQFDEGRLSNGKSNP
jgi:hypothetical protein